MKERHVVFGPPGTGKTTKLLSYVREHLSAGVAPERVGFLSFTRRAIREAKDAAADVTSDPLPYFRTIHSLAFQLLGILPTEVVGKAHLAVFSEAVGVPFSHTSTDHVLWEGEIGDKCLGLLALASARGTSLEHEWRLTPLDLPWRLVRQTCGMYEKFKTQQGLWDFDDMVSKATGKLDVDVLCVDEAQDTSTAQWAFLRRVAAHIPVVYFAGDDDQAIYHWSGADPAQLTRFRGDRAVLPISYRLPRRVKRLADLLANRIHQRVPKTFSPRDDDGAVTWVAEPEMVDLHRPGSWMLLARSNYQLRQLRLQARQQGVVYSMEDGKWSWNSAAVQSARLWESLRSGGTLTRIEAKTLNAFLATRRTLPRKDALSWGDFFPEGDPLTRDTVWFDALVNMPIRDREYVRALRRSGESLTKPGRVTIGTVHSVKGGQADHVVLMTDISERVARGAQTDPDAERRVQYVGVTRARQDLTLVLPQTSAFWTF
jgi:DNA helicase-2/ATP-dependent DNA helicase PcrA